MQQPARALIALPFITTYLATPVRADVVISLGATQGMTCSGGICSPTATDAVLNIGDLETLLASGSVTVTTTSSGVQAQNIDLTSPLSWSSSSALSLDAYQSLNFTASMSVTGPGGVSLTTNGGGSNGVLLFLQRANISFSNPTDMLTLNGTKYKLESSIRSLAYDIVAHPTRAFALATDIDAGHHLFRSLPIPVNFVGSFNGLGHSISNLEIADTSDTYVGLFGIMSSPGNIASIGLEDVRVIGNNASVGGLVGSTAGGSITNSWVTGKVQSDYAAGGLVGYNYSSVSDSWSSAKISGEGGTLGGLVGINDGTINGSFATGVVKSTQYALGIVGGLVGASYTLVENSYALGKIPDGSIIGGLVGQAQGSISSSYSAGRVASVGTAGGFIGSNTSTEKHCYWDRTMSKKLSGVGTGNSTGIIGLSAQRLRSGLPKGFDPSVWAENANINNGFPYLIANPPQ